ncbi:hypothetical protein [Halogeometricum limi]|uniref:Uncharacterized protein n=1 Tax=Halogeometricum limi TaxID=555875 RepID=A0A1I6HCD0_9EURY|nr:hypothetical protein [Halogeometricum limi]SFR52103.1 hypothetical protein SAMN04488124_2052 [Halogeometricum limi]
MENHTDAAILELAHGRYADAGDEYTLAAYADLSGTGGNRRSLFDPDGAEWAGYAVESFLLAAVCYRLAGDDERARNRVGQGILVVGDLRDDVLSDAVLRAACFEWVGHLRTVVGDADRAATAYDRAASGYADADPEDAVSWTTNPLLQAGTNAVCHLSRPDDVQWDEIHGSDPSTALTRRVQFARSRLPSMVAARIDAGTLHAPRGSTEYGTGQFRCPDCGSDDVNYVADTVLCLRCDTPVDRV